MTCARVLSFLGVLPGLLGCGIVVDVAAPDTDSGAGGTGGAPVTTTTSNTSSTSSTLSTSSSSSGAACVPADDGNPCTDDVCEGGAAVHQPKPAGTPLATQVPGDCKIAVCDGAGVTVSQSDDTDVPDDGNPCTIDVCMAGAPFHPAQPLGTPCGPSLFCDGNGACVACVTAADCPGTDDACQQRTCQAGTCGVAYTPANTPLPAQTSHDCKRVVCDGNGGVATLADDTDVPLDDGSACTDDLCKAGVAQHVAKPDGTTCAPGSVCQSGVCTATTTTCSAASNTVTWKGKLSAGVYGSYRLGPVTASPAGDVYVSDLGLLPAQKSTIHRFSPSGAYAGAAGGAGAGSGVFPPTFLGTSSLGDVLFSYYISSTGGVVTASATKKPPSGMGGKSLSALYNDPLGPYKLWFGNAGGDDAGRWLVDVDIQPGLNCSTPCGYDFGQGPELGHLLLRYDGAGNYLGSVPSPGTWRLAPSGHLYVVKGFQGTIDVGCGPVTGGAGNTTLLAKLDTNGSCLWSKAFPVPVPEVFVLGGDGSILFALRHSGALDFGGGPLPDFGAQNLTMARLDLDGNVLMARTVGGPGSSFGAMTFDSVPSGLLVLAGKFGGTVSLGATPLPSTGDTLLAVLESDGQVRWARVVNVGDKQYNFASVGLQMTRQPCNLVIATNSPTVDVGEGPVVPVPAPNLSPDIAVIGLAL